jgi:hypothetical protein
MSYKLQVVDNVNGISFNGRYERLDKEEKSPVTAKVGEVVVSEKNCMGDTPLQSGSLQRKWVGEDGKIYPADQVKFFYEGEEVGKVEQTKIFNVSAFDKLCHYTDKYAISAYYELFPDDDGMKKDIDKEVAINNNLAKMYKLWEFLDDQGMVARGEFNVSSRGFLASDGYIRAITIEGKWGLEIGLFKQAKQFNHLNEGKPEAKQVAAPSAKKVLKRV